MISFILRQIITFCEAIVIQLFFTSEQEDFTDASDDDVSDDDMEDFFTEENLGYAMKILEVMVCFLSLYVWMCVCVCVCLWRFVCEVDLRFFGITGSAIFFT